MNDESQVQRDSKITSSAAEKTVGELFRETRLMFNIPFFQRQFRWDGHKLNPLWKDIEALMDDPEDVHFLGVVISISRMVPGEFRPVEVHDVIDGQQRLTTLYLIFVAMCEHYAMNGELDIAEAIYTDFLVRKHQSDVDLATNLTLCMSQLDRPQIAKVFKRLLSKDDFRSIIRDDQLPRYAAPENEPEGARNEKLWKMYQLIRKKIRDLEDSGYTIQKLRAAICQRTTVVALTTTDARQGPKIFERWNDRGEPISVTDLVRNQIFALADDPGDLQRQHDDNWMPFLERFPRDDDGKALEGFFFPYSLIKDASLAKARVFSELRNKHWKDLDAGEILADMSEWSDYYLTLVRNENQIEMPAPSFKVLRTLLESGVSTMTYPFLMQVMKASKITSDWSAFEKICEVVESYIVRRGICRLDAGGLKAVFLNLWPKVEGELTGAKVATELRGQTTEKWPDNEEVQTAIARESLFSANILWFLLRSLEKFRGGTTERKDDESVEHILPRTPGENSTWWELFSTDQHQARRDTLPNLVPLGSSDNSKCGAKSYDPDKRTIYRKQSTFTTPRHVANEYETWDMAALDERADKLGNWVVQKWRRDEL